MLRFLGFFAEPAKTALRTTASVIGTTTLAYGASELANTVENKAKEKYKQFQNSHPELSPEERYTQNISYTLST